MLSRRLSKSHFFLILIILFVVFVRLRLLEFPLERDEGEYAYMGQLILQGIPPYLTAYNMKFPGTYAMYASIMAVFGQDIQGIHLGLTLINCASVIMVYLLARKFIAEPGSIMASAAYALLSLSPSVLGFAAHATHFVVLPALGGVLVFLHAITSGRLRTYFLSGNLLGLALLMKQPGVFFFLFAIIYTLYAHFTDISRTTEGAHYTRNSPKRLFFNLGSLSLGAALPLLLTVIWLHFAGSLGRFWFWTFQYAAKYGSQVPISEAFNIFKANLTAVTDGFLYLWIMAFFGIFTLLFHKGLRGKRVFIALFFFFSFLTICPGFYFRSHYFITLLPAVSILIGLFAEWLSDRSVALFKTPKTALFGITLFILAAGSGIAYEGEYLFREEPVKLSRKIYGANPFPESIEIAKFIKTQSGPADRIAIFGSEPQIFFYSDRQSATGYIYTYSLMERHDYALGMQKEMIEEVTSSEPKFIVLVSVDTSWLMRPDSEKYIFGWFNNYIRANYKLAGLADIISDEITVYKWYSDAQQYAFQSPHRVLIFERVGE
jgi:hypothetical protein